MRRGLVGLLLVLAPLLASCALNPPRIVSIAPSRETADVPANQAISITFDRPMRHDSVERHFSLQPALSGCSASRDCRFAWSGNTFMFLHPGVNFALDTLYTVSMHAGYADESGQQNSLDHSWRFTTEGPPTLTSVDPADGSSGVAPDRNIVLNFNRPMKVDSMRTALQVSPDIPFLLRGKPGGEGSQYEIVPTSALEANQTYTVTVDRPIDVHGNQIASKVQARFKTGSLTLARKIGYLIAQRGQPAFGIAVVDPHADSFLQRSTPKLIYGLGAQQQGTEQLISFDWSPNGQRLAVVAAQRSADSGPVQLIDLATGIPTQLGITASEVYWSADGALIYIRDGVLRRFNPATLTDTALTDPGDGRVVPPVTLSPDGKSAAYSSTDALGVTRLWLVNTDLRTRFRPPGLDDPADHPAWSPNGTKLAFRRVTSNGPELWVYDLSASGSAAYRRIGKLDVTAIAWLNDNSTLIAATGSGAGGSLYRVNIFSAAEAGGVVKVTGSKEAPNGSAPNTPVYDRRIAFSGQVDGLPQIYAMNGDGSRPQQLSQWEVDYPYTGSAPIWIPTG